MRLRSLLYVPASSEHFIARAHERGADAIVLDLEDSVAPDDKERARIALADAVQSVAQNGARVFVRINSQPEMQRADAEAACRAGAHGLYVAKTASPGRLHLLSFQLEAIERKLARAPMVFVPLLEDASAVFEARSIASCRRVLGLIAGGEDLALSMGGEPLPEVLRLPKLLVHLAAKAEGKLSFGTLTSIAGYSDLESLKSAAIEAHHHGFDGASCVHPSAIPILNAAFTPSTERLAWAHRIIAAADAAGHTAFSLDGRMIDLPVVAQARAILERARLLDGQIS